MQINKWDWVLVVLISLHIGTTYGMIVLDSRPTISRSEAREVYDGFAANGHPGGKDASSGYGGPAVTALLEMANFDEACTVFDYGCGQGKLAELVLSSSSNGALNWKGIDQSPNMVQAFQHRCINRFGANRCSVELLQSGDPNDVIVEPASMDRFVSTYCLDLLSEDDMYKVLDLAQKSLRPNGILLLAGITWGYRMSFKTFITTAIWEFVYKIRRKTVGGCRPQNLQPYLEAKGWRVEKLVTTLPNGFPWMASEVIAARPPLTKKSGEVMVPQDQ